VFRTGVPAFLGYSDGGPSAPVPVSSWAEFAREFGPAQPGHLGDAVRGFFDNDGQLCYLIRLPTGNVDPVEAMRFALARLDGFDDVDLICVPDALSTLPLAQPGVAETVEAAAVNTAVAVQKEALAYCASSERFAILDAVPYLDRVMVQAGALTATGYGANGALYLSGLGVGVRVGDAVVRRVPSCGHIAGAYAATDRRRGPYQPPANVELHGVSELTTDTTDTQAAAWYEHGVNCLMAMPGSGIRVWGARTLAGATEPRWRDVSTRRLMTTITRWIRRFMTELAFEPHVHGLRMRIVRELTGYLDGLFRVGALQGRTAAEAFFVRCDNETNPPRVVDAGLIVTKVGVAVAAPAEFVVIRVIREASEVTVDAA
jgi:phage tail sheath protein FI